MFPPPPPAMSQTLQLNVFDIVIFFILKMIHKNRHTVASNFILFWLICNVNKMDYNIAFVILNAHWLRVVLI